MSPQARKAEQFRALHIPGKPLVLFNIWDAGGAKVVAKAGAKAIATGSWSVAHANGFADGEHTPLALALDNLRRIVDATDLPVTIDLESGYGDTADAVGETSRLAIDAGAVGCNLEDSFPANGKLRETIDQCDRIRRVRRIADATGVRFFVNARTDVFFQRPPERHDDAMVVEAIKRARAYAEAGADGLFAPGLADVGLIARLAESSPLPLNIMVGDATPPCVSWRRGRCEGESWSPPLPAGDEGAGTSGARGERVTPGGPTDSEERMASIRKEIFINASPESVWDALRDVGALHTRLVPGFVTDTRLEPGARTVTFGNGQVVRELIVDLNEADRRLAWAVVDKPFQHYNASAQVFDEGQASCRFVWIADLLPNELANDVATMMEQGLCVIKQTMEASGVSASPASR